MNNKTIKVKMIANEIEALSSAYDMAIAAFNPETEHEELLCSLAAIMRRQLGFMLDKGQHQYTLHLPEVESMAFAQLWVLFKNQLGLYEGAVVQKIINHIHRDFVHA